MRAVATVNQEPLDGLTLERSPRRDQRATLSFPPFRLDVAEERLWKDGRELRLRPKPFAILHYLTQHPRRLVTRSEIVEAVWGKIAMSESLLRTHMHDLRQVLGEDIIETVVGRGYRFLPDIGEVDETRNGKPALELVRTPQSAKLGQAGDAAQAVLNELADALMTLGMRATVLLIVGDEQGERMATLLGLASECRRK
jgi:DNA-binding winged helix-turn-helix (wHTH) protein